jgi:hypothetical protein
MGKLVINLTNGHLENLKCASEQVAKTIVSKRKNIETWKFYSSGEFETTQQKKKENKKQSLNLEDLQNIKI